MLDRESRNLSLIAAALWAQGMHATAARGSQSSLVSDDDDGNM